MSSYNDTFLAIAAICSVCTLLIVLLNKIYSVVEGLRRVRGFESVVRWGIPVTFSVNDRGILIKSLIKSTKNMCHSFKLHTDEPNFLVYMGESGAKGHSGWILLDLDVNKDGRVRRVSRSTWYLNL